MKLVDIEKRLVELTLATLEPVRATHPQPYDYLYYGRRRPLWRVDPRGVGDEKPIVDPIHVRNLSFTPNARHSHLMRTIHT